MKPSLLICIPFPPPYSGEETLGLSLQQGLDAIADKSYDVSYFDISNKYSNRKRGQLNVANSLATLKLLFKFFILLLRERPQAIYLPLAQNTFGFLKYSLFIQFAALFRAKIILSFGGGSFDSFFANTSPFFKQWIRWSLKKIDMLVVLGDSLKAQFQGLVAPEKIKKVYLGLDPAPFLKMKRGAVSAPTSIQILFIGSVSEAKGAFDLLNALPLIAQKNRQIHLHLAGEVLDKERNIIHAAKSKNNEESFMALLQKPNVREFVTLHGIVQGEAKEKLFREADIFVLPSYSEAFPLVLLEASAAGLPLVITPVGANREVYRDKENALFVEPGEVAKLAEALLTLTENLSLRVSMGEKNRQWMLSDYTHRHFAERMDLLFLALFGIV